MCKKICRNCEWWTGGIGFKSSECDYFTIHIFKKNGLGVETRYKEGKKTKHLNSSEVCIFTGCEFGCIHFKEDKVRKQIIADSMLEKTRGSYDDKNNYGKLHP